jgi:hypothetical protein
MIMVKWLNLVISLHCFLLLPQPGTSLSAKSGPQAQQSEQLKQNNDFIVKPYLQLGLEAKSDASAATVVWFTSNDSSQMVGASTSS